MKQDFDGALRFVLTAEGGYSVDPVPTDMGIEQSEYNLYRNANGLPIQSVADITEAEAEVIYANHYWTPVHGDYLEAPVAYALFNYAVNTGCCQAIKFFQGVLGIPQTGDFDKATSTAYWGYVGKHQALMLADGIIARATAFYNALAAANPAAYSGYLAGWLNRNKALSDAIAALTAGS